MSNYPATPRTTFRRVPGRGSYDRAVVHAILDEALVCHVAFTHEDHPFVIPTTFARIDETLYVHGALASRMLRTLAQGVRVCVTVTLIDGLVLSRSWFHQSMNYRSVIVLGEAHELTDPEEKMRALRAIVERVSPGMSQRARPPHPKELAATRVLALPLVEVSAKTRSGGPLEEAHDTDPSVYSGHIPLRLCAFPAISNPDCRASVPGLPANINWTR